MTHASSSVSAAERVAPSDVVTESVRWLIDNAEAYRELLAAIGRARQSIWISQLAFDADCRSCADDDAGAGEPLLLDAILSASRARGVAVRILLNETLLLDTAAPLRAAVADSADADVRVRGIRRFPQLLHAKLLVVDEREALVMGSPFVNGYWDDSAHQPVDARRPTRELGGRPLHDVSVHLTGPAVHALAALFAELWNDVSTGDHDDALLEPRPRHGAYGKSAIDVVRTAPRRTLTRQPRGSTEILAAIARGLHSARQLLYVEHQYLSSRRVVDALAAALRRAPALEVVIVLNQNPDVTAYRVWQNERLTESSLLTHARVGVYTLWRATPSRADNARWTINQLFVHSKVLVVDDAWITMGSANLDGVSLHSYGHDFSSRLGQRVFRRVRNFDVNVVIDAGHHARTLRQRLWREHLALPDAPLADRPTEGWLSLWRSRARDALRVLHTPPAHTARAPLAIVLPYSAASTPGRQLRDAGLDTEHLDLRFDPSWLDVHCSPNWIRNMFT